MKTVTQGDNVKLAILVIVITVLALSLGDALIKQISARFPLWQIFVLRSVIVLPVLVAIIGVRNRGLPLVPRHVGWTALRSLMLTFMWVAYYAALPHVALSIAAAAYYTLPLFITLFAAVFVGETVGLRGWGAVCLGFLGVLLILKPQAADFNAYALLPLVAAVLYALAMILTRTKCRNESPLVLSFALNVSFVIVGGAATLLVWFSGPAIAQSGSPSFLLGAWIAMGPQEWSAMGLLALALLIGSVGAAIAYQLGPSSIVATYDFAYLAFAALWGLLFFAEVLDLVSVAGVVLIAAAGIIAVRR